MITKVGSDMGQGKQGARRRLYRRGGRGVAEAAADRVHRPLSLALARSRHALRGDAWRLCEAARQGRQDPLCRRSNLDAGQLRAALDVAKACAACRATRCCSPNTISTIAPPSTAPLRDLCVGRGDRRHHLFQPRQGLPQRQIPQRGRSRPKRARASDVRQLSEPARHAHPRRTGRRYRPGIRPSRRKSRLPG